jgi:threonine dehydrogenase-like Zn-dependent dehydrogenase
MTRVFGKVMQVGVFEQNIDLSPDLTSLITFRNITLRGCGGQNWGMALNALSPDFPYQTPGIGGFLW